MTKKQRYTRNSFDCYRVKPNSRIVLRDWDAGDSHLFGKSESKARQELDKLCEQLDDMQKVLYAENKHKILIVLQGLDTAGKDSLIRHVFGPLNPQGIKVTSFKAPSEEDLAHDYLWRIHMAVPRAGEIAVFNRSHYEDILIVAVHNLVSSKIWKKRYTHINHFERMLTDEGTVILKFFLYIDKNEQKMRLQARLTKPHKRWKFQSSDLKERKLWPQYIKAYESVLSKTSTAYAPWYIIPSNKKWYRDFVVAHIVLKKLQALKMRYPKPENLKDIEII